MTSETLTTRDGLVGNSPRYIGGISPAYQRFLKDDAGAAINLTGVPTANLAIVFVNQSNPSIVNIGTGTWTIVNASQGSVSYQYGVTDLLTGGNWYLFVTCQLIGEPAPRVFDPELLTVESQPFSDSGSSPIVTIQSINLTEVNGSPVSSSNAVPTSSADGANVAIGTTTDTSSATSVIGLLKAIKAYLGGTGVVTANAATATATISSVGASATNVTILASNSSRKGAYLYNDSSSAMYLAFAATSTTSAYTVKIPAYTFWEMPTSPVYTGAISALWDVATGNARVTALS